LLTKQRLARYDTIISPVLTTLTADMKTPEQRAALESLKLSFENAETQIPGA
jgi:hypothetical protein